MAQKVWNAYDRLTADDLNANFDWVRPRACRLYRSADAANAANVWLNLGAMVPLFDPDGMATPGGATITIPVAGLWVLDGEVIFATAPASVVALGWRFNGGVDPPVTDRWYISPTIVATAAYRGYLLRPMAAGDTVQLAVVSSATFTLTDSWVGARLVARS
jgi:hypothetical protein